MLQKSAGTYKTPRGKSLKNTFQARSAASHAPGKKKRGSEAALNRPPWEEVEER
jgi:hypothetical protein